MVGANEQQTVLVYIPLSEEWSLSTDNGAKDAANGRILWGVLFAAAVVLGVMCAATFSGPYPPPLSHTERLSQVMQTTPKAYMVVS